MSFSRRVGLQVMLVMRLPPPHPRVIRGRVDSGGDWKDDSFVSDYGVPISHDDRELDIDLNPDVEARLERELEGGKSDSDSSLDLHTPLP
jgi:hypothetical protein